MPAIKTLWTVPVVSLLLAISPPAARHRGAATPASVQVMPPKTYTPKSYTICGIAGAENCWTVGRPAN